MLTIRTRVLGQRVLLGSLLAVLMGLLPATPAAAQVDDTQTAKTKYASGAKHFDLSEYEEALADFKDAYRAKADPALLYNIGQCQRKLGHIDEAITLYQSYLRRAPDAKNRDEVERRIRELESLRDAQHAPAPVPNAPSPPVPAPAPVVTTAEATPDPPPPALDLRSSSEVPPPAPQPFYARWWFWTAVGAVVATATTVVIVMATRDPTKIPSSDLGSQRALP